MNKELTLSISNSISSFIKSGEFRFKLENFPDEAKVELCNLIMTEMQGIDGSKDLLQVVGNINFNNNLNVDEIYIELSNNIDSVGGDANEIINKCINDHINNDYSIKSDVDSYDDIDSLLSLSDDSSEEDLDTLLSSSDDKSDKEIDDLISLGDVDSSEEDIDALLSSSDDESDKEIDSLLSLSDDSSEEDLDTLLSGSDDESDKEIDSLLSLSDDSSEEDIDALLSTSDDKSDKEIDDLLSLGDDDSSEEDIDALLSNSDDASDKEIDDLLSLGDVDSSEEDLDTLLSSSDDKSDKEIDSLLSLSDDSSEEDIDALLSTSDDKSDKEIDDLLSLGDDDSSDEDLDVLLSTSDDDSSEEDIDALLSNSDNMSDEEVGFSLESENVDGDLDDEINLSELLDAENIDEVDNIEIIDGDILTPSNNKNPEYSLSHSDFDSSISDDDFGFDDDYKNNSDEELDLIFKNSGDNSSQVEIDEDLNTEGDNLDSKDDIDVFDDSLFSDDDDFKLNDDLKDEFFDDSVDDEIDDDEIDVDEIDDEDLFSDGDKDDDDIFNGHNDAVVDDNSEYEIPSHTIDKKSKKTLIASIVAIATVAVVGAGSLLILPDLMDDGDSVSDNKEIGKKLVKIDNKKKTIKKKSEDNVDLINLDEKFVSKEVPKEVPKDVPIKVNDSANNDVLVSKDIVELRRDITAIDKKFENLNSDFQNTARLNAETKNIALNSVKSAEDLINKELIQVKSENESFKDQILSKIEIDKAYQKETMLKLLEVSKNLKIEIEELKEKKADKDELLDAVTLIGLAFDDIDEVKDAINDFNDAQEKSSKTNPFANKIEIKKQITLTFPEVVDKKGSVDVDVKKEAKKATVGRDVSDTIINGKNSLKERESRRKTAKELLQERYEKRAMEQSKVSNKNKKEKVVKIDSVNFSKYKYTLSGTIEESIYLKNNTGSIKDYNVGDVLPGFGEIYKIYEDGSIYTSKGNFSFEVTKI